MEGLLLCFCMFCFGALASAGVFTVLSSISLVPRFAGKTRTAGEIRLYENMIILGTIWGGITSLTERPFQIGLPGWLSMPLLIVIGVFSGMFVGCIALAIAEMLDSFPIFFRRIKLKRGIAVMVFFIALGKLCGSLGSFMIK